MTQGAIDFGAGTAVTLHGRESVYVAHRAEVAQEAQRLASAADRVLAALQTGPQTNLQLIGICQRISGRIFDLRKRGYQITMERVEPGVYRYTLEWEHD